MLVGARQARTAGASNRTDSGEKVRVNNLGSTPSRLVGQGLDLDHQ